LRKEWANISSFWWWVDLGFADLDLIGAEGAFGGGCFYLNCTEREVSSTDASLFRNDREGVDWPLSTLEITDCLVLSFLAS